MLVDNPKQRLFLALLPPPALQEQVTAIKQQFAEQFASQAALRSPPHITLVPPFEWPSSDLPALTGSLEAFAKQQTPVAIQLSGFGAFAPRVIFRVSFLFTSCPPQNCSGYKLKPITTWGSFSTGKKRPLKPVRLCPT
ncbi:2'-5' RNA ligase family protein [Synechococcus sp. R55.6]|uniref:2'-5' RNA ligase family protein n=1 Tax=unclassified Synechococcus TaxID=2626047 RepID=UPI0039C24DD9